MRKITKKIGTVLLAGSLLATQMQGGLLANAASYDTDSADVEAAYEEYFEEHYKDNSNYLDAAFGTVDINGDSVDEMWVSYAYGVRGAYDFLYYKDGSVKKLKSFKSCSTVLCSEDQNQICVIQSSGAASTSYTAYKFTGSKFKKFASYKSNGTYGRNGKLKIVYYKNNKKISKAAYNKASRKYNSWDNLI